MTASDLPTAPVTGRPAARARGRWRAAAAALIVAAIGAALLGTEPASAAACPPSVVSAACSSTGHGAKPVPKKTAIWLVKYRVWKNHIKIYKDHKLVRDVPVAGNPYLSPQLPSTCRLAQKLRVNWDKTLVWRLDYFTRLCPGRGVGAHAIPINRYSGAPSMNAADLGKTPGAGSPVSHGCARMRLGDAKWIYDNVPLGTTVKISYAR